ncbi:hypothetical protein Glove_327g39 [Diversispora epigaea]|uniref:Uncharacterized protein n=1 Tax=Diversispora epigaea TaxID=1348612 RepID=A0A397HRD2_9GLOM|nr:hypothetical protein Glove_327g39 [Diversispora epigaea]
MEQNTINNLNEVVNEINEISIFDKPDTEETPKVDYGDYGICEECGNKNTDAYNVILNVFNKILEIGQVETKILMKSFKSLNQIVLELFPLLNGFHIPNLKTKYIDK